MKLGLRTLGFVAALAPFAMGASRIDVQMAFAALVATLGLVHLAVNLNAKAYQVKFVWLLLIPCCATGLQLVPMPIHWLEMLSPDAAQLYLQSNPDRSWAPLTVDYLATQAVLFHQLTFALVVCILSSAKPRQCRSLARLLLVVGVVSGLVALIHLMTGAKQIYGVYESIHRDTLQGFFGPFVNENTFGTLLLLAGFTGVGLTLDENRPIRLQITTLAILFCFIAAFSTGSRGAVPAALAGWLVFLILLGSSSGAMESSLRTRLKAVVIFIGGGLLFAVSASFILIKEWHLLTPEKLLEDPKWAIWSNAIDSSAAYLLVGSGRGTFTHVFNQFQSKAVDGTVTHAENILVQHLIESGLFLGIITVAVALLIWGLHVREFGRRPNGLAAGCLAALASVGVYQLSDFGLSAMGLSLPTAVVLGICFVSLGSSSSRQPVRLEVAVISGILILGVLSQFGSLSSLTADRHLHKLRTLDQAVAIEAEANRLANRHPADWLIPTIASQQLLAAEDSALKTTLSWANRAQLLAPQNAIPNLISAQALYKAGFLTQSAGEYRRALEKSPWDELTLMAKITRDYRSVSDLLQAVPDTPRSQRRLVDALFRLNETDKIVALADEILRWNPSSQFGHLTRMRACLKQKNTDCLNTVISWFKESGDPNMAHVIDARRLLLLGQPKQAMTLIDNAYQTGGKTNEAFLRQALRAYRLMNASDKVKTTLDALWTVSKSDPSKAFQVLILKARFDQKQSRLEPALISYDRALSLRPAVEYIVQAAEIELSLSRRGDALKRVEQALVKNPRNHRLKRLKNKIQRAEKQNR